MFADREGCIANMQTGPCGHVTQACQHFWRARRQLGLRRDVRWHLPANIRADRRSFAMCWIESIQVEGDGRLASDGCVRKGCKVRLCVCCDLDRACRSGAWSAAGGGWMPSGCMISLPTRFHVRQAACGNFVVMLCRRMFCCGGWLKACCDSLQSGCSVEMGADTNQPPAMVTVPHQSCTEYAFSGSPTRPNYHA
jgi:hypothetical protein